jgi:SNF2 family DNA or RNA helicase
MLHGIKAMSITGKHNSHVRAQTLLEFHQSSKSEVLFMSNVGIAGINLDCANIMIILVSDLSLVSISLITATLIGYPLVQAG